MAKQINNDEIVFVEEEWENHSGESIQKYIKSHLSGVKHIIKGGIAIYGVPNDNFNWDLNETLASLNNLGMKDSNDNLITYLDPETKNTIEGSTIENSSTGMKVSQARSFTVNLNNSNYYIIFPSEYLEDDITYRYSYKITSSNNETLTGNFGDDLDPTHSIPGYEIIKYNSSSGQALNVNATVSLTATKLTQ